MLTNPYFANAGYISAGDSSGALVRAADASRVCVIGSFVGGAASRRLVSDSSSTILSEGTDLAVSGMTKQLGVSAAGEVTLPPGVSTAIVNSSATPITKLVGYERRATGDTITLTAFDGSIVLQEGSGISLGSRGPSLTLPSGTAAQLQRFDLALGWVLTSTTA